MKEEKTKNKYKDILLSLSRLWQPALNPPGSSKHSCLPRLNFLLKEWSIICWLACPVDQRRHKSFLFLTSPCVHEFLQLSGCGLWEHPWKKTYTRGQLQILSTHPSWSYLHSNGWNKGGLGTCELWQEREQMWRQIRQKPEAEALTSWITI